ncbi:MAG: protein kinase [Myxococcales bacterium]|nr:protein kinase [Myxococcales bacterium]
MISKTLGGRYRVESHLGEGGMSSVYRAQHIAMAQPVAIKVLPTETTNDPSMVKRFIREARSCFRIDHPNCVRVTDFSAWEDGTLYFVMEYLDGRTMGGDLHVDGAMTPHARWHFFWNPRVICRQSRPRAKRSALLATSTPLAFAATKCSRIPDLHLEAAEKARRSGNVLKQLSEANANLKRNPRGRRAAYLAGEALQKSRDKVAACRLFRRAGKRHYRAAGCSN